MTVDWHQVACFYVDVLKVCAEHTASINSCARTKFHNENVGGHPASKHTFEGGWFMAADLWFDDPLDREQAQLELIQMGYHTYVGDHYADRQLHVQGWQVGETPGGTEQ